MASHQTEIEALVDRIAAGGPTRDLGGTMSRNVHLVDAGLVLRVHPATASPSRILAERRLKRVLLERGVRAAEPLPLEGREVIRSQGRVIELERWVEAHRDEPTWDGYQRLFEALGLAQRAWTGQRITAPRWSTWGPPGTLRGHLRTLATMDLSIGHRAQLAEVAELVRALDRAWTAPSLLPQAVTHGDGQLGNLQRDDQGRAVVFDLGFTACRPRVHDIAYASAWILLRPDDSGLTRPVDTEPLRACVATFERATGKALDELERRAFPGYLAGVCLYLTTISAKVDDPTVVLDDLGNQRLAEIAAKTLADPRWPLG